jgi:hypothetical protein
MEERNVTSDQPLNQVDLRVDGVKIDFPNHEEIKCTLKYLKSNRATELLINGGL